MPARKLMQLGNGCPRFMIKMQAVNNHQRRMKGGLLLKILQTLLQLLHAERVVQVGQDEPLPLQPPLQVRKLIAG